MELSLGFHMVFAAVGMAMPLMMVIAEWRAMRHADADARRLARTWSRVTAVIFAIGAVSGTALSFELGLLWPRFMVFAGPLVGPAFALEGYAFFVEAIFLGLYLYGWERLAPRTHWLCGWAVAISGIASGVLVLAVNAWMQHPVGFTLDASGAPTNVDPAALFTNPAWAALGAHSTLSTFQAVGFAAAGAYAFSLWRNRTPHLAAYQRGGLAIAMLVATGPALAQPVVGDALAKRAYVGQPAKLAAMESHFVTERRASLLIGGIPDLEAQTVRYAIAIPGFLSFMSASDFDAEVRGLQEFPRADWPNVIVMHVAFQAMVACGGVMLIVAMWYWWWRWRHRSDQEEMPSPLPRGLLLGLVVCAPLGFIALEAGWVVTEAGRQPWVIYGIMRTADAVTPVESVGGSLALFTALYATLLVILIAFLYRLPRDEARGVH